MLILNIEYTNMSETQKIFEIQLLEKNDGKYIFLAGELQIIIFSPACFKVAIAKHTFARLS